MNLQLQNAADFIGKWVRVDGYPKLVIFATRGVWFVGFDRDGFPHSINGAIHTVEIIDDDEAKAFRCEICCKGFWFEELGLEEEGDYYCNDCLIEMDFEAEREERRNHADYERAVRWL